jgi:predicted phage terminase large subunit-like protein
MTPLSSVRSSHSEPRAHRPRAIRRASERSQRTRSQPRERLELRPQAGPQEAFFVSPADIVIYGGSAGGGKSWSLLLEPLRHINNPNFGAVIFRREHVQIWNEGGLWDESQKIYPLLGGTPNGEGYWTFPLGATVTFGHLALERNIYSYQGAQIPLICFDELTHFTSKQFWYMFSRNRSMCGVRPYIRATTNPEADSWVAKLIEWWIDWDTGLAIEERSGVVRWLCKDGDKIHWGDSREEMAARFPERGEHDFKSFTFIKAKLEDNQKLLEVDPAYRGNLLVLDQVERERLLNGNWKIRPAAGLYFKRAYFEPTTYLRPNPSEIEDIIRYWDLAATEPHAQNPDPDWAVGTLFAKLKSGRYIVLDVVRVRGGPNDIERTIKATAERDGRTIRIGIELEPGSSGKTVGYQFKTRVLAGYRVDLLAPVGNKVVRAGPFSSQCEARNVDVLEGPWNEAWFAETEQFPTGAHDDQVDSVSGAFNALSKGKAGSRASK